MIDFVLPPLYHSGNLEGIQIELKVINELMKKHNKRFSILENSWAMSHGP